MHIPDNLFIRIVRLGKEPKEFVKDAVKEKLEREEK